MMSFVALTLLLRGSSTRRTTDSPSGLSSTISFSSLMTSCSNAKFVYGKDDILFGHIEEQQSEKPWGKVLDAGTGAHSLRWLATLPLDHLVAVTADATMQQNCQREVADLGMKDHANVIIGNWFDKTKPLEFEENEFDMILCDYLIGAMDGFSPYMQDVMIPKLVSYLKPQGRLYIVGLEPIPDDSGSVMSRVRQVRDACILLAGHRCYREYPGTWVERQVRNTPYLQYVHRQDFTILYRKNTIVKQIDVGRSKLPLMPECMRDSMRRLLDDLEQRAVEETQDDTKRIPLGFDYVITAEKDI